MNARPRGVKSLLSAAVGLFCACAFGFGIASAGGAPGPSERSETPGVVIEGRVTYSGPLLEPIRIDEAGTSRLPIEVDEETKGLKEAAVWLEGVERPEDANAAGDEPLEMDQRNYEFLPHVMTVEAGRPVAFLNNDAANHGVTASNARAANRFNTYTPPGGRYLHRFAPSRSPVKIGCPIHAAMSAWVFVFDHPFHDVTDAEGRFRLPPVPPGEYRLRVRHPDGGMTARRTVTAPEAEDRSEPIRIEVAFDAEDLDPPEG